VRQKITQQTISYITARGAEESSYTPILAAALNVPPLWLAYGFGPDPLQARQVPSLKLLSGTANRQTQEEEDGNFWPFSCTPEQYVRLPLVQRADMNGRVSMLVELNEAAFGINQGADARRGKKSQD
jgi:hypothetical protein